MNNVADIIMNKMVQGCVCGTNWDKVEAILLKLLPQCSLPGGCWANSSSLYFKLYQYLDHNRYCSLKYRVFKVTSIYRVGLNLYHKVITIICHFTVSQAFAK